MTLRKRFRQQPSASSSRQQKRRHLLETLEPRQLLAGPQLIGVQPNEGALIDEGTVRTVAPRSLTFRFDETQQIDPATFEGIRITRSGRDGTFGTPDDVVITPGLVTLGDIRQNEVVVRFAENLPDDHYRIDVFAFDDPGQGVVALRNVNGELLIPSVPGARTETINFKLNLGALIEGVVPQPVVRLQDGTLQQRRDEILVYFNEDELFAENDPATGLPTLRSVENPRFYQLLLTRDTVRTTDDIVYWPQRVIYDAATHTARLIFESDINKLPGVPLGGGTFRLRIGTAVEVGKPEGLILEPLSLAPPGAIADTLTSAFDLNVGISGGQFITDGTKTSSVVVTGAIDPVAFGVQLPGGSSDPGRLDLPEIAGGGLLQSINERFGPDSTQGVTEIAYNFQSVYATTFGGTALLNQITDRQKTRIREAVSLWGNYVGVQFRETRNEGITFAVGDPAALPSLGLQTSTPAVRSVLNASLRIDPDYVDSAIVFSNETQFNTAYGEDFFRKAMAGIGFLIGLEQSTELTAQSLMSLSTLFLNQTINPTLPNGNVNLLQLRDLEPSFPGNLDILHGQHVHRPDGIDVDLYRFVVELGPGNRAGTFTAETFAERLPDSSLLDSTLRLFQETRASATTDFGLGTTLSVRLTAVQPGELGNNARIDFVRTTGGSIVVQQRNDSSGKPIPNAIEIQVPRNVAVSIGDLVNAINNHAFASTLFRAELLVGSANTNISGAALDRPVLLAGGGIEELTRNDDYFSDDSFLTASLANGIYYIGIAASGNDRYDPQLTASGFGGRTQGTYELALKFEPQVGVVDAIRDLDSQRVGVPGTAVDGDGDGIPGGVKNFWFQTRPLERLLEVTTDGSAIIAGQTFTLVGANGASRRFEFVPTPGGTAQPGNIAILYNPLTTQSVGLAVAIRSAIDSVRGALGITATIPDGTRPVISLLGERSIRFDENFRGVEALGRTVFVDKAAGVNADGSLARPFNNISNAAVPNAFGSVSPDDIVRIVGNGGQDGNLATAGDNFAYQIGTSETGGGSLEDGRNMLVPRNVTVMIDAGAAFKLRNSAIVVGSTSLLADRSGGALQVLGTPRLVNLSNPVLQGTGVVDAGVSLLGESGSVVFTSTRDRAVDASAAGNSPTPTEGNWGGIIFRRDLDQSEGRFDLEDEGIFLQSVNHADIRFGGGSNVLIESIQQTVNPVQMVNLRPNVTFNRLTNNAGAAMSASPDSFEETSYQSPRFQQAGSFTADYSRVGPDIKNNLLSNNSINGLFIRAETAPNLPLRQLTVAGRLDDTDIVHYVAENVIIAGNPGGSIQDGVRPQLEDVAGLAIPGGGTLSSGSYRYQVTFVDRFGFESLAASAPTSAITVGNRGAIELFNLPAVPSSSDYISRRLYRQASGGSEFLLVADLDASSSQFIDDGRRSGVPLDQARQGVRGRLNASLVIDAGTIVKFRGARIELGHGTQLLAEGLPGLPVVFTSASDDRFGTGGSFDTNNDSRTPGGGSAPTRGDWAGIYAGPTAHVSLDHAVVAYGGGESLLEGGQSKGFSALELHQATARVTNSRFENNANGQGGAGPVGRNGRLGNTPSTIFARFTQPVLVGNQFVENRGAIIDIDSDSMIDAHVIDLGRQTGPVDRLSDLDDNHGPLVRRNTSESTPSDSAAQRQLNGMYVRGGIVSASSVWDDTDIVHMVFETIVLGNQVSGGALRLQSRPDESLVVKISGSADTHSLTVGTGFNVTGSPSNLSDRIGGTLHILGMPGAPVVMTSILDDTVGAGRRLDGSQQTDTNGDSFGSRPFPNDWRGLYFDQFSNDRNVAILLEQELSTEVPPGLNATVDNAQFLGELAETFVASDDRLRLGFEVHGFLSGQTDVDTYSFTGAAGTPVWIDIDKTSVALNSVIEILDSSGNVLARSTNSFDEVGDPSLIAVVGNTLQGKVGPLSRFDGSFAERGEFGLYEDFGSTNSHDAGLSMVLPGPTGTRSVYYVRVRSASVNPADDAGGLTRGGYTVQVRLQETQEFPGSVVKFADIRYANHGIRVQGLPGSSPLLGDIAETEAANFQASNNGITGGNTLIARPQYVGNLATTKGGAISIAGELSTATDVDFYRFDVNFPGQGLANLQRSTVFDIDYADGFSRPDTNLSVFFDDGTGPRLVLVGTNSNIAEDQASPLGDELGELLARGSVSGGDPFIGPVSLRQGTYFIAVTENGRLPVELQSNPLLRREPLDSVLRIFEDHVEEIGGSTALPPREGIFVDSFSPGWSVTTERATDPGHQRTATFNGSRIATAFPPSVQFESEPNNSFPAATDLETIPWSLALDPNIGSASANTSESIPHTTVPGSIDGDIVDLFRFEVTQNNSLVFLDIDGGFDPVDETGPGSVDLKLQLFEQIVDPVTGATSRVLRQTNSLAPASNGASGSQPGTPGNPLTTFSADPFIQTILNAGTYFVAVSPEATTYDAATEVFALDVANRPATGNYLLHVSVANHPFAGGNPSNQSYHFDRSEPTGTLESAAFDLSGYAAADLPRFYFSHFYAPSAGDSVVVRARSDQQPAPFTLTANLQPAPDLQTWSQQVLSLERFAGNTGVVIEFVYQTGGGTFAEGLYLDDFIVGFAERGEIVSQARPNSTDFTFGGFGAQSGEYQLEMRLGTEYASPIIGGLNLTDTFDTNDRHARQVTLVAPAGDQISNGDRFTLNDGASTVTFEFNTAGGFSPNVVRIAYSTTDTATQIAQRLINVINSSVVQASLKIKASPASSNTSLTTTDARVNLHGTANGQFESIASIAEAPATLTSTPRSGGGRNLVMPAILHDGVGDFNTVRTQGQVIIDSNRISDSKGIGIWSETPPRLTDPRDTQFNFSPIGPIFGFNQFVTGPPIGITGGGAVKNLPTLNDTVTGGLIPGVVAVNNIVDQAGYSGIKIDGQTTPLVIDVPSVFIADGHTIVIDAAGTRVVLEFDDLGGVAVMQRGSGVVGGDGFVDGHVPIYYRASDNAGGSGTYPTGGRNTPSTPEEILVAIQNAINGSTLVTNNLVGLVKASIGPSVFASSTGFGSPLALYLEGASAVYFSNSFQKVGGASPRVQRLPLAEAPQPFARIVNNTIYGSDGTEAQFAGAGSDEPNDTIAGAVDTKVGRSHRGAYVTQGVIGDNVSPLPPDRDVDLYKVELGAGDRLVVDVDTLAAGPGTVLRVFDSSGIAQPFITGGGVTSTRSLAGPTPSHLNPGSTTTTPTTDDDNARDSFIDFTTTLKGTYYIGVSSQGNDDYDPLSFAGRKEGTGGTGTYTVAIDVYAPRDFVLSVDNGNNAFNGSNTGTRAIDLIGTTFSIVQIPDYNGTGPFANVNAFGNRVTFEFTSSEVGVVRANGNINIPLFIGGSDDGYRVPEIMRAIASAIGRVQNNIPVLPNHERGDGPDGRNGPVSRITAVALGGASGDNATISKTFSGDYQTGFGHNRLETLAASIISGGLSDGRGTSELYVVVEKAARIELSPEARAAGLRMSSDLSAANFAVESDQLLTEHGVLITQGASPTLVNNVFVNLHQSVVAEETSPTGFGNQIQVDQFYKSQQIIVTGNVFQYDEPRNTRIRADVTTPFISSANQGITTDAQTGPSNINGGNTDFNFTVPGAVGVLANPAGDRMAPSSNSPIIDSAINSLADRDTLGALKLSVGIPLSNILAPDRDNSGQLRADNPNVASPGGVGANVFKDRGALDLADFVGPVAIIEFPRDNDAAGIDTDPAESFLQLNSGIYDEFRVLLRDTGDASDPFVGSGIDDDTVVAPALPGLRQAGANVALFEGDRLLAEGIDYTFSYDATRGLITLRPIAGVWRDDRAYRISINNRDRLVLLAPGAGAIGDGDSFLVVDNSGGRVTFEFESGYELRISEALQFAVPRSGTAAGGITDGSRFSISGISGNPVFFEFDRDGVFLPSSRVIGFQIGDSPEAIAQAAVAAIQSAVNDGLLDVTPVASGRNVIIGSEAGIVLDASRTALITAPQTIALAIPSVIAGPGGIADGDILTISDGNRSIRFEFDTNSVFNPINTPIDIGSFTQADSVRDAILDAINDSPLRIEPLVIGGLIFLNLPAGGSASVSGGQLAVVGLSRTPTDGSTITFTPASGDPVTLVLDRTDDDQPLPAGIRIEFTRATTADQLAQRIAAAIRALQIPGLDTAAVLANPGGQVAIGGEPGLELTLDPSSTLQVVGQPGVSGPSLLTIAGPLLLQLPIVGGSAIPDDSQFTLTDGISTVTFQYNQVLTGASNPQALEIPYRSFDDVQAIATATVAAINNAGLNITATNPGSGRISLGDIDESQFSFPTAPPPANPGDPVVPVIPAPLSPRRGIVNDGEKIIITQGSQTLRLEFDAATAGGGVSAGFIPVVFQPGSTVDDVASVLAAAINNNRGSLDLAASALPGGRVQLGDTSQTVVDVSAAPTIALSGTPGGGVAVQFSGAFGPEEMKRALIDAINRANGDGLTSLTAENRGGGTLFIENALLIEGPVDNYSLQAVKDLAGNPLKPNRDDNTTQFTLLLPTVGLDYGDAPDPRNGVVGRYPTQLANDGARHVVDPGGVRLGRLIDIDTDGMPSPLADGDDTTIFVLGTSGPLFSAVVRPGFVEVTFNLTGSPADFDGNTVTLSTGVDTATLEFDVDGLFNENHFAVSPNDPMSLASIAQAFADAVRESPLRPADVVVQGNTVRVITDDEDGVVFTSSVNPGGILNPGVPLEISVTVTGSGVLEAWIDFNFDGDWNDPNEQIINAGTPGAVFVGDPSGAAITRTFTINVPATAPRPTVPTLTYARFRVSAEGGLSPTGLALSGEVEDHALTILPGLPPNVNASNRSLSYSVAEDGILQARDADGTLTPGIANDNGILAGVQDPDGDQIGVFAQDVGPRTLLDDSGVVAGELTLFDDGTFTFVPTPDYFGTTSFTARVTDLKPLAPETQLVSPTPITTTITVLPVNDRPFVSGPPPVINRTVAEDAVITFTAAELTAFYLPGPPNESSQPLLIQSAGIGGLGFQTQLGGTVQIIGGNVRYTPPANFPGPGPDRFNYVVADDPADPNQLVETAATLGTVIITITGVNDPPIIGNDSYSFEGDGPFSIPIGTPGVAGSILGNDLPGPADEIAAGQTISLVRNEFPKMTQRGGTVSISANGQGLVYTPPANFSGPDQFTYTVVDTGTPAASATGTVFLSIDGDNAAPAFVGINGDPNRQSLQFNESKEVEQVVDFNLNSWFVDPEGDASTFTVTSSDPSVVNASVIVDPATGASTLRLRLPSFRFGNLVLNIVATNVGGGPSGTAQIPVTVTNTPDPPVLIGTLDPLSASEDDLITRDLSQVFFDPDGGQLTYAVTRIGNILNPTAAQIAASGLVQSITFTGNQMRISLVPDASGTAMLEITASDGTFSVTDAFILNIAAVPDPPRGEPDFYNVPIGGRLQMLNPAQGLIANDTDPDTDVFPGSNQRVRVQLSSVTQPTFGTLEINADGTFVYTNTTGQTGDTDTFTYRPIDPTGLVGNTTTVTLNLGRSLYQNPIPGFSFDVTADGFISPLDALLILNLLSANRTAEVSVSSLTVAPPPFYDVNGDGRVQPLDALLVITEIARRNRLQLSPGGEGELDPALLASTSTVYAASSIGLPESSVLSTEADPALMISASPQDDLASFSFDLDVLEDPSDRLAEDVIAARHANHLADELSQAVDKVLLMWLEPTTL